jgi:hypothetical protein
MEHTQIYRERRAYEQYDADHFLLYLNEQEADYTPPRGGHFGEEEEQPAPLPGYSYTGNHPSGGTMVAAKEATYGALVSGLIRLLYTADAEQAVQANMVFALANKNHAKAAQYKAEHSTYQDYRDACKAKAKVVLGVE